MIKSFIHKGLKNFFYKGTKKGINPKQHEIYVVSVAGAWRVTFKIEDGNVYIIDYLNYH